mmetsp:Transcript_9048/g.24900  ORF Transcript_9048/g.24900 Transcript_9048/m.24900 type:complete len:352 (+) Transcript_9048:1-1056(+)
MTATSLVRVAAFTLLCATARAARVPLRARLPRYFVRMGAAERSVSVSRGPGGLGIEVNSDNLIVSSTADGLSVGDVVTAVDDEPLAGRYVGKVLSPESSEFTFTISRDPAVSTPLLERALLGLGTDLEQPAIEEIGAEERERVIGVVGALEEMAAGVAPVDVGAAVQGFWKLLLGSGLPSATGLSGMGGNAGCTFVAQWQGFSEAEPTAQVVEIIADPLLGRHAVAALKGSLDLQDAPALSDDGERGGLALLSEHYTRLEVGGALAGNEGKSVSNLCTYVSDQLRICRPEEADGEFSCFWRTTPEAAQMEIGTLSEAPVGGAAARDEEDDMPRWARRDWDDDGPEALSDIP